MWHPELPEMKAAVVVVVIIIIIVVVNLFRYPR